jgi:hypothetical protein
VLPPLTAGRQRTGPTGGRGPDRLGVEEQTDWG